MNSTDPDKKCTVSLNLDDDGQLMVQNMNEDKTAKLLKDLFLDFSYAKRNRKQRRD